MINKVSKAVNKELKGKYFIHSELGRIFQLTVVDYGKSIKTRFKLQDGSSVSPCFLSSFSLLSPLFLFSLALTNTLSVLVVFSLTHPPFG